MYPGCRYVHGRILQTNSLDVALIHVRRNQVLQCSILQYIHIICQRDTILHLQKSKSISGSQPHFIFHDTPITLVVPSHLFSLYIFYSPLLYIVILYDDDAQCVCVCAAYISYTVLPPHASSRVSPLLPKGGVKFIVRWVLRQSNKEARQKGKRRRVSVLHTRTKGEHQLQLLRLRWKSSLGPFSSLFIFFFLLFVFL